MSFDLKKLHSKISPVIEDANKLLVRDFTGNIEAFIKYGQQLSTSTLTQTDLRLGQLYRSKLKKIFPDFGFLTEEIKDDLAGGFNWVIDELDGTANFANKIPVFGTSVALWDMEKDAPVYGVVSFPIQNEIIYAFLNGGMYLNNKKVIPFKQKRPQISSVYAFVGNNREKLALLQKLAKVIPLPENYHCASFHLVITALGRIDCAVFSNMPIWDIAAGVCIAKEAGLKIEYASEKPSLKSNTTREYKYWLVAAEKVLSERVFKILNTFKRVS